MKTAIAISPMMTNVLSVAKIPPATVTASQTARIAPMIVPMIRPMYSVCAGSPAGGGLVGAWHVMTAGLRDVKVNENRPIWSPNLGVFA
jgi:hypothetical protein